MVQVRIVTLMGVGVVVMDSRTQVVEVVLDQVDVQKDIMVVEDLVLSSSHILLDK